MSSDFTMQPTHPTDAVNDLFGVAGAKPMHSCVSRTMLAHVQSTWFSFAKNVSEFATKTEWFACPPPGAFNLIDGQSRMPCSFFPLKHCPSKQKTMTGSCVWPWTHQCAKSVGHACCQLTWEIQHWLRVVFRVICSERSKSIDFDIVLLHHFCNWIWCFARWFNVHFFLF